MAHAAGSASAIASSAARLPADGIRGGQGQERPQPLAAGEHAVAHRFREKGRAGRRRRRGIARAPRSTARARAPEKLARRRGDHRSRLGSAGKRGGRRLQLATVGQDLDAALGVLEPGVTEARELHAALVQRQRLLEREVAFLELLDDRLELGDRAFEVLDGSISMTGHADSLQCNFAPAQASPGHDHPAARPTASRMTRVRSSFQQTA